MGAVIIIALPLSCQCALQLREGSFGSPHQKLWPLIVLHKGQKEVQKTEHHKINKECPEERAFR